MLPLASRHVISQAVTASTPTANLTQAPSVAVDQARSLAVVINITGYSAGNLTVTIKGSSASGATWTILTSAALSANGTTVLRISPDLAASANVTAQDIVPPNLVVSAVSATSPVFTYTVDVEAGY